jgi:hypothetical protein
MPEQTTLLKKHATAIISLRNFFLVSIVFNLIGLTICLPSTYGLGSIFGFSGSLLLELSPIFLSLFIGILGVFLLGTQYAKVVISLGRRVLGVFRKLGMINWVVWGILILGYGYIFLQDIEIPSFINFPQIWLFGHILLLGRFS